MEPTLYALFSTFHLLVCLYVLYHCGCVLVDRWFLRWSLMGEMLGVLLFVVRAVSVLIGCRLIAIMLLQFDQVGLLALNVVALIVVWIQ